MQTRLLITESSPDPSPSLESPADRFDRLQQDTVRIFREILRAEGWPARSLMCAFDNLTWPTCAHLIWPTLG